MQIIFFSVFIACMIVFPFFIISSARAQSPKRKEEALNQAIKEGHVVTAVLKKRYASVDDPYSRSGSGMVDMGVYVYTYNGKDYKYKLYCDGLPATIQLYFIKNPRKAVPAVDLASTKVNWLLRIAIVACVIYLFCRSYS